MSDADGDGTDELTEEQIRQGFEEMYGVSVAEVMDVLTERLAADHQLRERIEAASEDLDATGFTDEEQESMQGIQDYVDERD